MSQAGSEVRHEGRRQAVRLFLIVLAAFLALGIPFKVMVLVEGFTEVRPVNAVPPVAGLVAGPVGALACGLGNLIADLFGTFSASSVLGVVGNALAAYLPWRLWHLFSDEAPNVHHAKTMALYAFVCLSAATTVAWVLGFGLYYLFGPWIESIYVYVVFNDIGFSLGLGMPLLIMLTSEDVRVDCAPAPRRQIVPARVARVAAVTHVALMLVVMTSVCLLGLSPESAPWLAPLSLASLVTLALQLV